MKDEKVVKQEYIEDIIHSLHMRINQSAFRIGKLLTDLQESIIPSGQWKAYLTSTQTQERLGFGWRTAMRYIDGYKEASAMPTTRITALEAKGVDPASPATLAMVGKVLEIRGPRMEPMLFADEVKRGLAENKSRKHPAKIAHQNRAELLLQYVRRLYAHVPFRAIERDIHELLTQLQQQRTEKAA